MLKDLTLPVVFKKDSEYKPRLKRIIADQTAQYSIEYKIEEGATSFRIIRIKETVRTHDFIIDNCIKAEGLKENEKLILIENLNSQQTSLKFESFEDLLNFFTYIFDTSNGIYNSYTRPSGNRYYVDEETKLSLTEFQKLFDHINPQKVD